MILSGDKIPCFGDAVHRAPKPWLCAHALNHWFDRDIYGITPIDALNCIHALTQSHLCFAGQKVLIHLVKINFVFAQILSFQKTYNLW